MVHEPHQNGTAPPGRNGKPEPTSWPDYWARRRLVREANLPAHLKHFLHVLMDYAGDENDARASVELLALDLSTTRRRVQMTFSLLERGMGLIETIERPGRPSSRRINCGALHRIRRQGSAPESAPTCALQGAPDDGEGAPCRAPGGALHGAQGSAPESAGERPVERPNTHRTLRNTQEEHEEARTSCAADSGPTNGTKPRKAKSVETTADGRTVLTAAAVAKLESWARTEAPRCVGRMAELGAACLDWHASKGKVLKDHLAAVRNWARNDRRFATNGNAPRNGQRPDTGNVAAMQDWLRTRGEHHVAH